MIPSRAALAALASIAATALRRVAVWLYIAANIAVYAAAIFFIERMRK